MRRYGSYKRRTPKKLAPAVVAPPRVYDRTKEYPPTSKNFMWDEFDRARRYAKIVYAADEVAQYAFVWEVWDRKCPSPTEDEIQALVEQRWQELKHLSCGRDRCRALFTGELRQPDCDEKCCPLCGSRIHEYPARVVSDTGWDLASSSNPRRGIRDYVRRVALAPDTTSEEKTAFFDYVREHDCPGWTGLCIREHSGLDFTLTTTYDSSD